MSVTIQESKARASYCPCSDWNGWGRLGTLASLVFQAIALATRPACSALTRAYPRSLVDAGCGCLVLLATACAPASHAADPTELAAELAAEVEPRQPATPYAVYASSTLNASAVEAAHTRQATRILNDRLGAEIFVWSGFADDPGCDSVLVTRGETDGVYLENCRWLIELAEGGTESDAEVVTILRLLLVTIDGPHWEQP